MRQAAVAGAPREVFGVLGSWEEEQGGEGVAHERGRAQRGHARPDKRASTVSSLGRIARRSGD